MKKSYLKPFVNVLYSEDKDIMLYGSLETDSVDFMPDWVEVSATT